MNKMTLAEITDVIKAARQGKQIEMNAADNPPDSGWIKCTGIPNWNFTLMCYRARKNHVIVPLSNGYNAIVNPIDRSIMVGCITITSEKIEELLQALQK